MLALKCIKKQVAPQKSLKASPYKKSLPTLTLKNRLGSTNGNYLIQHHVSPSLHSSKAFSSSRLNRTEFKDFFSSPQKKNLGLTKSEKNIINNNFINNFQLLRRSQLPSTKRFSTLQSVKPTASVFAAPKPLSGSSLDSQKIRLLTQQSKLNHFNGIRSFSQTDDSGFHDDFKSIKKEYQGEETENSEEQIHKQISELVGAHPVVVFMKGTPQAPRCGFSAGVVQLLQLSGLPQFHSFDVLSDQNIRSGIKSYTQWPTIPQVFMEKEFVGGFDVIKEMHESGELKERISQLPKVEETKQTQE